MEQFMTMDFHMFEGHQIGVPDRNSTAYELRQIRSERDEVGTANPVSVSMLNERISGAGFDAATKPLQQAKIYVPKRIYPS